jgi:hypothetical protein
MDWYSFRAIDSSGNIVITWIYNLFYDWQTHLPDGTFINEMYRPENASVPLIIPIMLIISLFIGVYGVSVYDIEKKEDFTTMKKYGYTNFIILLLNGFFILVFPIYYLIPNELYYPFMNYNNVELGMQFIYCMGTGYIMQILAFALIFPYAVFYYQTVQTFEKSWQSSHNHMEKVLEKVIEPLDLDKFIREEELVQKRMIQHSGQNAVNSSEIDEIYHEFLEARGIK